MKYFFNNSLILAASLFILASCGGGSSSSSSEGMDLDISPSSSEGMDLDISPQFEDAQVTIAEGGNYDGPLTELTLNSEVSDSLTEFEYHSYMYEATADGWVVVQLDMQTEVDFDLLVIGDGVYLASTSDGSESELLMFSVQSGDVIFVEVDAFTGSGTYSLTFSELNRTSLGLADKEHLLSFDSEVLEQCIVSGAQQEPFEYYDSYYVIFNFAKGYYRRLGLSDHEDLDNVSESGVTFSSRSEDEEEGVSITTSTSSGVMLFNSELNGGTLSLTSSFEYREFEGGEIVFTEACELTEEATFDIIL